MNLKEFNNTAQTSWMKSISNQQSPLYRGPVNKTAIGQAVFTFQESDKKFQLSSITPNNKTLAAIFGQQPGQSPLKLAPPIQKKRFIFPP